jgi:hypothetical protein
LGDEFLNAYKNAARIAPEASMPRLEEGELAASKNESFPNALPDFPNASLNAPEACILYIICALFKT